MFLTTDNQHVINIKKIRNAVEKSMYFFNIRVIIFSFLM